MRMHMAVVRPFVLVRVEVERAAPPAQEQPNRERGDHRANQRFGQPLD